MPVFMSQAAYTTSPWAAPIGQHRRVSAIISTLMLGLAVLIASISPGKAEPVVRQLAGSWTLNIVANGSAQIRVFHGGDGPAIVMLPGRSRGPAALEPLASLLAKAGFRIVLPEPRGYGASTGPLDNVSLRDLSADVIQAIESVSKPPVVLLGHAYGNRIARMLAADRPDLVRATVLLAAGGKFPPKPEAGQNLRIYLDKSKPADVRIEAARAALFGPKSNPKHEDFMLDMISDNANRAQLSAADPNKIPLDAWWHGGTSPMLVIQGLADVIAPPENGRLLKSDHPQRVTLVEFEDLGHEMEIERPDLMAEAITEFVKKLEK